MSGVRVLEEEMMDCQCGKSIFGHYDMCFPCLVVELLVSEHGVDREQAETLVNAKTHILTNGIMAGNLRSTAMALFIVQGL